MCRGDIRKRRHEWNVSTQDTEVDRYSEYSISAWQFLIDRHFSEYPRSWNREVSPFQYASSRAWSPTFGCSKLCLKIGYAWVTGMHPLPKKMTHILSILSFLRQVAQSRPAPRCPCARTWDRESVACRLYRNQHGELLLKKWVCVCVCAHKILVKIDKIGLENI